MRAITKRHAHIGNEHAYNWLFLTYMRLPRCFRTRFVFDVRKVYVQQK